MPIFELIQEEYASQEVKQTYQKIKARYRGSCPTSTRPLPTTTEYLASINEHMTRVLRPRKVDAKTKEVIAFTVAAMNGCDFCIHAHTMGLRRHGYDDEAIAEILGAVSL